MVNYWVFVVNDWTDKDGNKHRAREIFQTLMSDKIWGIGDKTPNRKSLSAGDKVAIYQAGESGQNFLGVGTLKAACKPFGKDNRYSEKSNTIVKAWGNIVQFEEIVVFEQPKPLQDLAKKLEFIVKKEMPAVYFQSGVRSITHQDFEVIASDKFIKVSERGQEEGIENESQFVLEKYLQDFIVSNWNKINFGRKFSIFKDENGNMGSQYTTNIGYIDILAVDEKGNFLVVELKKGRESDKVVGQLLRYMGWVKKNLTKGGEKVEGLIICKENDEKMEYAISATHGIAIKHYSIDFKLF